MLIMNKRTKSTRKETEEPNQDTRKKEKRKLQYLAIWEADTMKQA